MLWHTRREPQQQMLCGCSVLLLAARPNLSGYGIDNPHRRRT